MHRPLLRRRAGQIAAVEQNLPGIRQVEAGDHAQDGGLAAAGRPEQGEELAASTPKLTSFTASKSPKRRVTLRISSRAIAAPMRWLTKLRERQHGQQQRNYRQPAVAPLLLRQHDGQAGFQFFQTLAAQCLVHQARQLRQHVPM